jgi:carotenoid cleavage dioxygenase-like enzyme
MLFCKTKLLFYIGNLPSWLQGTLLRNGPGIFSVGDTTYNHWFDGMALMHSFTFKDGKMTGSVYLFCDIETRTR